MWHEPSAQTQVLWWFISKTGYYYLYGIMRSMILSIFFFKKKIRTPVSKGESSFTPPIEISLLNSLINLAQ
ncbi:hypothetical protein L873DRAFT_1453405 [Choiromyces venosus 120613-1]|uniref:Uncharacterized protein n=1 Tax=Choiromyces venosus 120613-1 TaxID=1336337 RepID=A0A3N4K0Q6_9PEZI|nr:hypothetical protein L873DRAFT_1453405 [Choiromyces venosus 120613-1]